jgi:membrane protein implicated in regulation of membrane protease activity
VGYVYFGALLVGLGVLLLQLVLSHHSTSGHGGDHDPGGSDVVATLLSTRFWVFAALGFGLSGFLLHVLSLAGMGLTLGLAIGMGLVSGSFAAYAFRFVARSQISSNADAANAAGRVARVLVACTRERVGQVRVELQGQSVDLMATTDEEEIPRGAHVVIEEVRGAIAHVSRAPKELE